MTSLANEATTITAHKVNSKGRMSFLPNFFGTRYFMFGERAVYKYADHFSETYRAKGAYWEFYILSNGSGFMAPAINADLTFSNNMNGYSGTMTPEAFGIVVTCFALGRCWEESPSDDLVRKLTSLKDYAAEHPEHAAIFAALD